MKNFAKSKGKRITAALLCAVMCIMSLPLSAFAFTAEEGKTVDAYYGDRYFGSDGDYYYSPESHQYIAYDENGNTSLHSASGVHRRTKLMIKDSSGSRQIMCIESGIDYNAGGTYSSVNGKNSSYFQNLPTTAQYGIMLTSVYGWRPGTTAPISGTNEDDFSMATQTILWEYQQQLRTSPTTLKANSYGVPADTYYQCIKGRPAEKCYDWLLTQMQSHATIPSFASNKSSSATTYTLKYNQAADNYSLTLTDTNNTLSDIKFSASGITVSRSGNKYTFTSNKMIETAVSVTAQKNVPGIDGNFLVWGYPGKQTMMSGAEDPVVFYLKIKTETTGVGHIVKHSEDGKVANIKFNITGNGVNQTVTTKVFIPFPLILRSNFPRREVYYMADIKTRDAVKGTIKTIDKAAVAGQRMKQAYDNKLLEIRNGNTYDVLEMSGSRAVWKEVLSVYSVKVNTDPDNPQEVATMDDSKKQLLKDIFWEMNSISSRTESKSETVITETDDGNGNIVQTETTVTRTYLYITVSHKTVDEMAAQYGFNQEQKDYLTELLQDKNNSLWSSVLYGITASDDQIVTVALSQIGNVGGEPYWSWYGFGSRVEWCACFVSWCANECGYIDTGVIPKFAGCVNGVQWFKDRGQWMDGSAEPVPGMIIFFDWDNKGSSGPQDGLSDHVGIVQKVENGIVYTVEGNSGDSVRVNQYSVGHYEVLGYGVPQY